MNEYKCECAVKCMCCGQVKEQVTKYLETLKDKIKERDSKMYGYYKSVFENGFEGGYPSEWDEFMK